jgi:DNA modification methylase
MPKIIPGPNDHPTPKPIALPEWFIRLHSQPGDLIVDPFMGGGSTILAARNLGRRFIGSDLDSQWVNLTRSRIEKPYTVPMFDAPVQTEPAAEQRGMFDEPAA